MALRSRRRGLFGTILLVLFSLAAALAIGFVALALVYISVPPISTLMLGALDLRASRRPASMSRCQRFRPTCAAR